MAAAAPTPALPQDAPDRADSPDAPVVAAAMLAAAVASGMAEATEPVALESKPDWSNVDQAEIGRIMTDVRNAVEENIAAFTARPLRSNKFLPLLQRISALLNAVNTRAFAVASIAPLHDIAPECPYNGFRSVLVAFVRCLSSLQSALDVCTQERSALFFRADMVYEQLNEYGVKMLTAFSTVLAMASRLHDLLPDGQRFCDAEHNADAMEIVRVGHALDVSCFFGHRAGFQYNAELQRVMRIIVLALAGFSDGYHSESKNTLTRGMVSAWAAFKYALHPEEQAAKLVDLLRAKSAPFVKSFFNLTESTLAKNFSRLATPRLSVNRVFYIASFPLLHATPSGLLPVLPDIVGSLGQLRAQANEADPISQAFGTTVLQAVRELFAAKTQAELYAVAQSQVPMCEGPDVLESPLERRALRRMLLQAYMIAQNQLALAQRIQSTKPAVQPAQQADETQAADRGRAGEQVAEVAEHLAAAREVPGVAGEPDSSKAAAEVTAHQQEESVSSVPPSASSWSAVDLAEVRAEEAAAAAAAAGTAATEDPEAAEAHTPKAAEANTPKATPDTSSATASHTKLDDRVSYELPAFGSIRVRLVSHHRHAGQLRHAPRHSSSSEPRVETEAHTHPPADNLLIHMHGGGFIANSSESHLVFLGPWAHDIGSTVIVSIDYSLAPEAPYPRAAQECYYTYIWCLEQAALLGTHAKRVCVTGDSAGGNLAVSVVLRALMEGARVPDVVFAYYPALHVSLSLSASRLMSSFDPMLSQYVLETSLEAYVGKDRLASAITTDPLLSPMCAPDDLLRRFPPIILIAPEMDPLLDDSLAFSTRLKNLGVRFGLLVLRAAPHGFLNFKDASDDTQRYFARCTSLMDRALNGPVAFADIPEDEWVTWLPSH